MKMQVIPCEVRFEFLNIVTVYPLLGNDSVNTFPCVVRGKWLYGNVRQYKKVVEWSKESSV
jgi:hypothetical protein